MLNNYKIMKGIVDVENSSCQGRQGLMPARLALAASLCLSAVALVQARRAGISFTPLPEKPARHRELRRGGRGRTHCNKNS